MSIVNQVSKNNVIYDMNDKRVVVLDIGSISMVEGQFQAVISYADAEAFFNAEEGLLKFTYSGTEVVCKTIAKNQSGTIKMTMCSMFLQTQENTYTSFMCQVMGDSSEQAGAVNGYMVEQTIPQGGGSGGDGVPVVAYTGLQWQEDGDAKYVELELTEEDYTTLTTNDVVMIKATDEDNETLYLLNTAISQEGGSDMYMFGCFNPESLAIAMVQRADDGEGGYNYYGAIYKAKMPSGESTLYIHEVQMTDNSDTYRLKFISKEQSEVETYYNLVDILSAYTKTFDIVYEDEKTDCYNIASIGYTSGSQATTLNYISSGSISSVSLSTFESMTISDNVSTL
mgnify:CR=1 FL=1